MGGIRVGMGTVGREKKGKKDAQKVLSVCNEKYLMVFETSAESASEHLQWYVLHQTRNL